MGCGASGGTSDIYVAVDAGDAAKVRSLIRAHPGKGTVGTNAVGDSILHHAAWKEPGDKASCLNALLEAPGLDINAVNKTGWTALHLAAAHGKEACMRELLRSGAKYDVQEPGAGETPLHLAALYAQAPCLQAAVDCLDSGKIPNLQNKAGKTPLHLAAEGGHLECVQVLLAGKVDVNHLGGGASALHGAAAAGHREVAEVLIRAGADPQLKNAEGKTPWELAVGAGQQALAERLGAAPKEEDSLAGRAATAPERRGAVADGQPEGLSPASEETRQHVQELMDETWKDTRTRDRVGSGRVARFEVVQVQQNSSKELWGHYCARRDELALHYAEKLKDIKTVVQAWEEGLEEPRRDDVNEFFLFHGTKPQAVTAICGGGFRVELSGSNRGSLYGSGIYCAESSAKADEYAEDDKEGLYKGLYAMLLCRVSLGNPVVTEEVEPNVPELQRLLESGDKHSIVGDREKARGTYREFILQDPRQVYPAFAVIYRRRKDS